MFSSECEGTHTKVAAVSTADIRKHISEVDWAGDVGGAAEMTNLRCETWVTVRTQTTILPADKGGVGWCGREGVLVSTFNSFSGFIQANSIETI